MSGHQMLHQNTGDRNNENPVGCDTYSSTVRQTPQVRRSRDDHFAQEREHGTDCRGFPGAELPRSWHATSLLQPPSSRPSCSSPRRIRSKSEFTRRTMHTSNGDAAHFDVEIWLAKNDDDDELFQACELAVRAEKSDSSDFFGESRRASTRHASTACSELLQPHRVALAAEYVRQVIHGEVYPLPFCVALTATQLRIFQLWNSWLSRQLHLFSACMLLLIGGVECPPQYGIRAPLATLISSAIIASNFAMKYAFLGHVLFWRHENGRLQWVHLIQVGSIVIITADAVSHLIGCHNCLLRGLLRAFRAIHIVCHYRESRIDATLFFRTLPNAMPILFVIGCITVFWALLAYVLFETVPHQGVGITRDSAGRFRSVSASLWQTVVLISCANTPEIEMPAYIHNKWYITFFISFKILVSYLLLNLLYVTVYTTYFDGHKYFLQKLLLHHSSCLQHAFYLLVDDASGVIAESTICDLLVCLGVTRWRLEVWHAMTVETLPIGPVHRTTFMLEYPKALRLALGALRPVVRPRGWYTELRAVIGYSYHRRLSQKLRAVAVAYKAFHCLLIVWGCAAAVCSVGNDEKPWWRPEGRDAPLVSECLCCLFFLIDLVLSVLALGFRQAYVWSVSRLDLPCHVASFAGLVCLLAFSSEAQGPKGWAYRLVCCIRVARTVRCLPTLPDQLQNPLRMTVKLLPRVRKLALVLLALYYIFVVVGQGLFRNTITTDKEEVADDPNGNYYDKDNPANFYLLNFDSFMNGTVTLFNLMILNNWYVIVEAHMRAPGTDDFSCVVYFLSWYVTMGLLFVNVLTAFVAELVTRWKANVGKQVLEPLCHAAPWGERQVSDDSQKSDMQTNRNDKVSRDSRERVTVAGQQYQMTVVKTVMLHQAELFKDENALVVALQRQAEQVELPRVAEAAEDELQM